MRGGRGKGGGGYHTNVRSIVISVSILFGLITEGGVGGGAGDGGGDAAAVGYVDTTRR